ncbi:hypothetical protein LCM4573_10840 [Rhizobium sp. LCM 4573]|nr:hypothetical protein LCM4573_10840 [Rhizobium sp. LCM 4573]
MLLLYAMLVEVDDLDRQVDSKVTSFLNELRFTGTIKNPLQKAQFIGVDRLKQTSMIFKH